MAKKKSPAVLEINPRIQRLKEDIISSGHFDEATIKDRRITDLFKPLLNQLSIPLIEPGFAYPDDNSLQVTTFAGLFSREIMITAVFVADDKDGLSLAMNSYMDFSMLLSAIYAAGLVPGGSSTENIPEVEISGLSFLLESAASTFTLKGKGGQWSFLGYTNPVLDINEPALTLVSSVKDGLRGCKWSVSGTLADRSGRVDIPLSVGLPIGFTGWTISAGPLTLDNGVYILDSLTGLRVSEMLPQTFIELLRNIEITSFYAGFDPIEKRLNTVQLMVETKAAWVIVRDELRVNEGIRLVLNGFRMGSDQPLTYSGNITGTAAVNYSNKSKEVQATASIPVPMVGSDWSITLENEDQKLGFGKLAVLIPGVEDFLPAGLYEKLNEILLEYLTIKFRFNNGFSFTRVAFSLYSTSRWQLPALQQLIYLDEHFSMKLDAPVRFDPNTATGELSGIIQIDNGNIPIPVKLSKSPEGTGWTLAVTSEMIPLPSIGALTGFMGGSVLEAASPPGLMKFGDFAIFDLELLWLFGKPSTLQRFAFTVRSQSEQAAWNLVPGYFELTDLFVTIVIQNKSVSDKDISGSIGATVTWILNREKGSRLVLYMLATKPSSKAPWKFAGSLQEDLILKDLLLALKTPTVVVDQLPNLKVTQFDLSIEPNSGSFSIAMSMAPADPWPIFSILDTEIYMDNISFSVKKYAKNLEMAARGSFQLVKDKKSATVQLSAGYKNEDWSFTGIFDNSKDGITINEVLGEYIPGIDMGSIPQLGIKKASVEMLRGKTAARKDYHTFGFGLSGEMTVLGAVIQAKVDVRYDSRKEIPKQYDGTELQGAVIFGGLTLTARAKCVNKKFDEKEYELRFKRVVLSVKPVEKDGRTILPFTLKSPDPKKGLTLGDVIVFLIETITGDAPSIPSPWDFILNIPIEGLVLRYIQDNTTKKRTVELSWTLDINLGFVTIDELSIRYLPDQNGKVEFKVVRGTFLGKKIDELTPEVLPGWDLRDPSQAPPVPGFGTDSFKLEFLGLGNQVAIVGKTPPASVTQAIADLDAVFKPDGGDKLPPQLYFDKNYGILFGTKFILVKYIEVAAVFYDPVLYGLNIKVTKGKFDGLNFQVLYKKITETIGVFQIDLVLPNRVRKQQFGAASVTLPSLSLSIYTNGDFIIDMGFPKNGDFSRSFGLEFSIFTGAGGFYFGKLSNDTATNMPGGKGQFNPVIIFGIGIRAGLGRRFSAGPLKAEVSLMLQVILEGVLAWYNEDSSPDANEVLYYKLQAQASLVGRIYGEIDFVIITASLDVTVRVMLRLMLEAYRQSLVTFTAEVSASVKVRINLGLFSITITCSFRTRYSDSFTIGRNEKAPWDSGQLVDRSAFFTPLDAPIEVDLPEMRWSAPLDYPQEQLDLLFVPQVSLQHDAAAATKKRGLAVSLLFIQNVPDSGDDSAFTVLARAFLAWVFNAYFAGKGIAGKKILDQSVVIEDVNAMYAYFDQEGIATGAKDAFGVGDLYEYFFAKAFTAVHISTQQEKMQVVSPDGEEQVAFFPILPSMAMTVNEDASIKFSEFNKCDPAYLGRIREYFREMQIQYRETQQDGLVRQAEDLTMAEFLFINYFVMMAKTGLQDVINDFKQTALVVHAGDSLNAIAGRYRSYGVTAAMLAQANRHLPLKESALLRIPGASSLYTIPPGGSASSLRSVADRFGVDVEALAAANADEADIFSEGTRLLHAFVETKTVRQILDELQQDAQHSLANLAGVVSRFFLHGIRIPREVAEDGRIALYAATGQQFALTGTVAGQKVTLDVPGGSPEWLKLGADAKLVFNFDQEMSDAVAKLLDSTYVPGITLDKQEDIRRYRLQPRTFALATSFTWQDPNLLPPIAERSRERVQRMGDRGETREVLLWTFPALLQQYVTDYDNIAYRLMIQSTNTAFSQTDAEPVPPMFWSTYISVSLRRVPDSSIAGNYLENIYVVEGCGEADGRLLQRLLTASDVKIDHLDILYADNTARPNDGEEVNGLVSHVLTQYRTFLLQTNYSTISNPGVVSSEAELFPASNLLGMSAITFLTYLWECSIVRSGGYYLYYNITYNVPASGSGLPGYIFDEEGVGTIRILVSYKNREPVDSGGYVLPAYVNSVVTEMKIDPEQDTFFAEIALTPDQQKSFDPVLQNMQATILPGTGIFKGKRANPQSMVAATLQESADQQLSELFQLMEFRIEETAGVFKNSHYALPAGPLDTGESLQNCLSALSGPMQTVIWNYGSVAPVYRFVENGRDELEEDPYAANGKTATIYFNFLDIFGNTLAAEDASGIVQRVTPGYTDPIIGIDQWINVARSYEVGEETSDSGAGLRIQLVFDPLRYKDAQDPKTLATQDLKQYRQTAYQLAQRGVVATVQTTIGGLNAPATPPLQVLQKYVTEIVDFLRLVERSGAAGDKPIVARFDYGIDITTLNPAFLFQLSVSITITRTLYIDPQFERERAIKTAMTAIPPDLYSGATSEKTALSIFASRLEGVLPVMKVAVGANGDSKEIWLVRFATAEDAGIRISVARSVVSFGVKPLSTTLISRPDDTHGSVPMRTYTTGKYLGKEAVEEKAFAGVDMEVLARTFVSAMDAFFSVESSTRAWRLERTNTSYNFNYPFEAVEQAKRSISKAVADSQLTTILEGADPAGLSAAQEALEQQLLVVMGNMYKTVAVAQTAVTVSQGFDEPTANLYGQLVFADAGLSENSYSFTPIKVSLAKGEQTINSLFSVRQETGTTGAGEDVDLIDRFRAGLNLQIMGVEFDFGEPIHGYVPSSWLTFANSILLDRDDDTPLIDANIPVPLKAYPTAPSLVGQRALGSVSGGRGLVSERGLVSGQGSVSGGRDRFAGPEDDLAKALLWDYSFSYNYITARQDLIYLDVQLNVENVSSAKSQDDPPDLFEALMQFNDSYEAVVADIAMDNGESSFIALESFAWMVKRVADAWPVWFATNGQRGAVQKKSLRYIVREEAETGTGGKLLISIQRQQAELTPGPWPLITIGGFKTKVYSSLDDKQTYYFEEVTDTTELPLLFDERKQFSERGVVVRANNVLLDENAWAGVSVHRNEILAGEPTNKAFRYITPYIRFANVCYPSLTNQEPFNIADFTRGAEKGKKVKLEILLLNFFSALFKADPAKKVMLKIQAGYSYFLQPATSPIQLGPILPIALVPPVAVTGETVGVVLEPFSRMVLKWFSEHAVVGRDTTGNIRVIVSLFGFGNGQMHHPMLTLEGVYLPARVVVFD